MIKEALSIAGLVIAEKGARIVITEVGKQVTQKIPHPLIRTSYHEIFSHTAKRVNPTLPQTEREITEETDYSTDIYLYEIGAPTAMELELNRQN